MAHKLPAFPLEAEIWRAFDKGDPVTVVESPCEIYCRRVFLLNTAPAGPGFSSFIEELWFPKGTDLRGYADAVQGDWVRVGGVQGVFYQVLHVSDHAKGFANEFRVCWCLREKNTGREFPLP